MHYVYGCFVCGIDNFDFKLSPQKCRHTCYERMGKNLDFVLIIKSKTMKFSIILQIRVVFLYWLPCILRMSRPNQEAYELEKAEKKAAQLQSVELKERY